MVELRLPNITGLSEKEQLSQIKSYLYQLTGQLQWALSNLESTTQSVMVNTQKTGSNSLEKVDAEATFNSVKALIIKSAEIVEAYYEEMSKSFSGEYVAQSDFGTYKETTNQTIKETSTGIEQLLTNVQKLESDVASLDLEIISDAYIKTGFLGNDEVTGAAIYGLEIRQKDSFSDGREYGRLARFTSDRLSFFDQYDQEAAYISNYELYIYNVRILKTYSIGGFIDTVDSSKDVVTKWVGGEG